MYVCVKINNSLLLWLLRKHGIVCILKNDWTTSFGCEKHISYTYESLTGCVRIYTLIWMCLCAQIYYYVQAKWKMVKFISVRCWEERVKCCDNDDYHKKNMTSSLPTNLWWNNFIEAKASKLWIECERKRKSILWWICECNEWDNETDIEIIFSR